MGSTRPLTLVEKCMKDLVDKILNKVNVVYTIRIDQYRNELKRKKKLPTLPSLKTEEQIIGFKKGIEYSLIQIRFFLDKPLYED